VSSHPEPPGAPPEEAQEPKPGPANEGAWACCSTVGHVAGLEGGAPAGDDLRVPRDPQQREQYEVDTHRHLGMCVYRNLGWRAGGGRCERSKRWCALMVGTAAPHGDWHGSATPLQVCGATPHPAGPSPGGRPSELRRYWETASNGRRHLRVARQAKLLILRPNGGGGALRVVELTHVAQVYEAEQRPAEQEEEQRHCRQRWRGGEVERWRWRWRGARGEVQEERWRWGGRGAGR